MGVGIDVRLMLYLAAALQVVAACVALLVIPISGRRVSWVVLCLGLVLQAWRRVYAVGSNATLVEATTALAVSVLLLAGVVGIRSVFLSLKHATHQLQRERARSGSFLNRVGAAIVFASTSTAGSPTPMLPQRDTRPATEDLIGKTGSRLRVG